MPALRHRATLEVARNVRAFLRLEAGLTRGEIPDLELQLRRAQRRIAKQARRIARQRRRLAAKGRRPAQRRTQNPDQTYRLLAERNRSLAERPGGDAARTLYLEMVKRCLTDAVYGDAEVQGRFPPVAHTMIGFDRLDNLQSCVESVLREGVSGDLIETGVWRGGATILMRAVLEAYGVEDRLVWAADSFEGLPPPDVERYPEDAGDDLHTFRRFKVSVEQVRANFERYGLLDDRVRFLEGWFRDTLPDAPMERLAVIRLDGDMYESTMDALVNLYPKLSAGGYLIVDDYGNFPACRQAVHDYRERRGVREEIVPVDWSAIYWRHAG